MTELGTVTKKDSLSVIAVTGWLRSGTTILAEVLGSCRNTLALGELHNVWRAWTLNTPCSCGALAQDCEVWGAAMEGVAIDDGHARHLSAVGARLVRNRQLLKLRSPSSQNPEVDEYLQALAALLVGLSASSKCSTLIDTSKSGPDLLLMCRLHLARYDVIHTVRDLRGVAWSQKQRLGDVWRAAGDPIPPPQRSLSRSAAEWSAGNLAIAYVGRRWASSYARVSYEELFGSPRASVEALASDLGLDCSPLEWDPTGTIVTLRTQHQIAGNVNRFGPRERRLQVDDSWRAALPRSARLALGAVALATSPLSRPTRTFSFAPLDALAETGD